MQRKRIRWSHLLVCALASALIMAAPGVVRALVDAHKKEHANVDVVVVPGFGIDPQYAERFFVICKPRHTRDEYVGTGIGLAICKKIVERHGGKIWLESESGKEAPFFFTLPA